MRRRNWFTAWAAVKAMDGVNGKLCVWFWHTDAYRAFTGLLKMEKAAKEIKSVTLFLSCWSGLKTSLLLSKGFYSFLCAGHWYIIQINWADAITSGLVGIIHIIRICYITNKSLFSFFKSPHFTKPEMRPSSLPSGRNCPEQKRASSVILSRLSGVQN